MTSAASVCRMTKRFVVLVVVLQVLSVRFVTERLGDGSGRSFDEARNGAIGAVSNHLHTRTDHVRTPSLAVRTAATHNLSPPPPPPPTTTTTTTTLPSSLDVHGLVERVHPRAFPLWNNLTVTLPCPPAEINWTSELVQKASSPTPTGILYVKVHKTASSTGSSVNHRLASRIYQKVVAPSLSDPPPNQPRVCRGRFMHSPAHVIGYGRRDKLRSVLWTIVRDPTDRAVSLFFHLSISRGGRNASDDSVFRNFLWENRNTLPSFQARYLSFRELAVADNVTAADVVEERRAMRRGKVLRVPVPKPSPHPAVSVETIRSILRGYDFVGVTERMDESLVALQLLLGLETADILYMSSKVSGGYDDGLSPRGCVVIQRSFRTPAMQEFFKGPVWRRWSKWDVVLHRAANRSLDLTIASLGPERFYGQLEAFRSLRRDVSEACSRHVRFPCDASRDGQGPRSRTDCILGDTGCGFDCIDRHVAALAAKAGAERL